MVVGVVGRAGGRTGALALVVLVAAFAGGFPSAAVALQTAPSRDAGQTNTSAQRLPPAQQDSVPQRVPRPEPSRRELLRDLIDVIARPPIERPMDGPDPAFEEPFQPQRLPPEPAPEREPAFEAVAEPVQPVVAQPRPVAPARPGSSVAPAAARPVPPVAAPPTPRPQAARPAQQAAPAQPSVASPTPATSAIALPPAAATVRAPGPPIAVPDSVSRAEDRPADPASGGRTYWPWLLIVAALVAVAAGVHRWRLRQMLDRTRSALALRPSLDPAEGNCVADGLVLAGPAMSIRSRLEMGSSAWQTR